MHLEDINNVAETSTFFDLITFGPQDGKYDAIFPGNHSQRSWKILKSTLTCEVFRNLNYEVKSEIESKNISLINAFSEQDLCFFYQHHLSCDVTHAGRWTNTSGNCKTNSIRPFYLIISKLS